MTEFGAKRRRWFDYERVSDALRAKREAAYFNVGAEYGIARTRAMRLTSARNKTIKARAQRVVREVMRIAVAPDEVIRALVVAAWAVVGWRTVKRFRKP